MPRRMGVIGDVHAEDASLDAVITFMQQQNVDTYLCVGDIVDGAGDPDRCCELLRSCKAHVVRGNHERWMASNQMRVLPNAHQRDQLQPDNTIWLEALPVNISLETPIGKLLLCHGLGTNDMESLLPDETGYALQCKPELERILYESEFKMVVSGHSHRRMFRQLDGITFINGGTLRRMNQPCFAVIDFEERRVAFHDVAETLLTPAESYTF